MSAHLLLGATREPAVGFQEGHCSPGCSCVYRTAAFVSKWCFGPSKTNKQLKTFHYFCSQKYGARSEPTLNGKGGSPGDGRQTRYCHSFQPPSITAVTKEQKKTDFLLPSKRIKQHQFSQQERRNQRGRGRIKTTRGQRSQTGRSWRQTGPILCGLQGSLSCCF